MLGRRILGINAEETCPHKLELVSRLCLNQCRLNRTILQHGKRIGIDIDGSVLVVDTLLLINDVLVQADLSATAG